MRDEGSEDQEQHCQGHLPHCKEVQGKPKHEVFKKKKERRAEKEKNDEKVRLLEEQNSREVCRRIRYRD